MKRRVLLLYGADQAFKLFTVNQSNLHALREGAGPLCEGSGADKETVVGPFGGNDTGLGISPLLALDQRRCAVLPEEQIHATVCASGRRACFVPVPAERLEHEPLEVLPAQGPNRRDGCCRS